MRKKILGEERQSLEKEKFSFEFGSELALERRQRLRDVLTFGIISNFIAGFLVITFVGRQIVQRLHWIADNAKSFGEGKRPIYAIPGNDELAFLNKTFQQMTDALEQALERERHTARTDALSGLPNRRYFVEEFDRMYSLFQRHKQDVSVVILDSRVSMTHTVILRAMRP